MLSPNRFLPPIQLTDGTPLPRILPGPLEGVMGGDLCQVMMEFDLVPAWITPFIRVTTNVPGVRRIKAHVAPFADRPVIVQLMGTHPETIAATAARAVSLPSVIGIELNCACPSKTVMNKGSGAALLATPEWIPVAIDAIRQAVPQVNLGVKVRAGATSPDEIASIMPCVAEAKPDWCVMHYRTAQEFYSSVIDGWSRFDVAKAILPNTPLLASGDLFTVEDCLRLGTNHPVEGMTPARGLMQNPWLIRQVEAELSGEPMVMGNVTSLLVRLAELGIDKPNWKVGRLLEIAGMAWGRDSDKFNALVGPKDARSVIDRLKALP